MIAVLIALGLAGPGGAALDAWRVPQFPQLDRIPEWQVFVATLGVTLLGVGFGLALSQRHSQLTQRTA